MRANKLVVKVAGATNAEFACGLPAAQRMFDAGGAKPRDAAFGRFERDGWDNAGFPNPVPPEETFRLAKLWDDADTAALEACCAGWPKKPYCALELLDDDEPETEWGFGARQSTFSFI